ncbi:Uncharacterized protein YebE, UPF0316 family [Cyclobacterium lianum]|uniref:UPF0316 protein SAMN04488057_10194 n=1 Tax=Cyclobacterium lianum TaxID=388280 RepID=A0A1M7HWM1_9BACT|nr:DUF2179 domain-containing protein [Cyclobacterium lianum]SHM32971.1 Uncharacterized protein YebE, UPF0316 family [Cyclobacterium lianum]
MQEFFASFGISQPFFDYLLMPLLIFLARVVDVSINTLRIMFVLNGKKTIAPVMGFFEALIWLLAIGQIFQNINNPMSYVAYAGGYAMGTYIGMVIEERLALGRVLVRIITPEPLPELVQYMKDKEYRFTSVGAEGRYGKVILMFTVIKREFLPDLIGKLRKSNEKAFYTIESVKRISEDDLNVMEDRPRFSTRLRNLIRK